ncbi:MULTISPECIES: hypothetical protein [unclassified Isoptericola]|uniref:hypothetical protein n=1 Tax=unclassified Isoptericola TaxID=2623355 RepID=UPI003660BCC3
MNEFLYYDEFRLREAEAEQTLLRDVERREALTGGDRRGRGRVAARRRADRRVWGLLTAGTSRSWTL